MDGPVSNGAHTTRWFVRQTGVPVIIAVVHLAPLPGAPLFGGDFAAVRARALEEARQLQAGGADALIVENFGDTPFFPEHVPAVTVAAMAVVAAELRAAVDLPLGINVLRNDARAALSVAAVAGAAFIRVNVHSGARVTDQGVLQGRAYETMRERALLGAAQVAVFADVHVKHSAALAERPLIEEAAELTHRAMADAVLVTGIGTGSAPHPDRVAELRAALPHAALLVASGVTPENAKVLLRHADGCIVGSALKHGGDARRGVDLERATRVIAALKASR